MPQLHISPQMCYGVASFVDTTSVMTPGGGLIGRRLQMYKRSPYPVLDTASSRRWSSQFRKETRQRDTVESACARCGTVIGSGCGT